MEEGSVKFASGGDDIKVWDLSSSVPVLQFSPHAGPISSLCWHQNNEHQLLASASQAGDKIVLSYGKSSATSVIEIADGEKQTCLALSSTSRYLACGGKNQLVSIWDLKSRKLKRTYKEHKDSITCVVFNWNDSYLASGSASGEILLHNVVSGQPGPPMVVSKAQTVRDVGYSYFKKSLLAAASDDGSLTLWDTNTNKLITPFADAHNAPATSLSFSPLNNLLLASVGLDKRVVCYDVNGKSIIKTMTVESPLTSLCFMQDGATLAAGSTRGKIYIFDLRMGSLPINTLTAHKSSVQCIRFQNPSTSSKTNGPASKSAKVTSSQKKSSASSTSTSSVVREQGEPGSHIPDNVKSSKESLNEKTPTDPSPRFEQLDNMDIISPIREAGGDPTTSRLPVKNGTMSVTEDRPETMGKAEITQQRHNSLPGAGLFSPLSSEGDNVDGSVRRNPIGSVAMEASPFGPIRRAFPTNLDGVENGNAVNSVRFKSPLHSSGFPTNPPSPRRTSFPSTSSDTRRIPSSLNIPPVGIDTDIVSLTSTQSGYRPVFSPEEPPPESFSKGFPPPSPSSYPREDMEMRTQEAMEEEEEKDRQSSEGAAGNSQQSTPFQTFQVEFIKNLIEESLDQFRIAIHRDVTNLQLEMLRQFQIQQNEIQSLLERYSVNEGLIAEIETLREENKRLKAKY